MFLQEAFEVWYLLFRCALAFLDDVRNLLRVEHADARRVSDVMTDSGNRWLPTGLRLRVDENTFAEFAREIREDKEVTQDQAPSVQECFRGFPCFGKRRKVDYNRNEIACSVVWTSALTRFPGEALR